jgi:hypothetical protein
MLPVPEENRLTRARETTGFLLAQAQPPMFGEFAEASGLGRKAVTEITSATGGRLYWQITEFASQA